MTHSPTAPAGRELHGNFLLLRADALHLLLPQHDVGAATHLEAAPQPTDMPGFFVHGDAANPQPVVALASDMRPLAQFPADRFFVTAIATPLGEIGFGWSEVSVLLDARLHAQAVPTALLTDQTPLREFVEIDGRVVFCCDSARLAEYAFANAGPTA